MKKIFSKFKLILAVALLAMTFTGLTAFTGSVTPVKSVQAAIDDYVLYKAVANTTLYKTEFGNAKKATIKKGEVVLFVNQSSGYRMKVLTLTHGTGYASIGSYTKINSKNLKVNNYKQENGYYCGPATCKQVLSHYSVNKTQKQLAKALGTTTDGTTMTNIPGVLNKYQDKHTYKYYNYSSKDDFQKKVLLSIANGYPVVIDIKTKNTSYASDWGYNTNGHYMNISAFNIKNNTITVTDPHPTYCRVKAYKADLVYNVVNSHWRKAIIY